ncbi:MAG TPA: MFS transporter [Planctomycetota bacterium]|nr:MFS transporter [Planctomycetota bacterium]
MDSNPSAAASRTRYGVIVFGVFLAAIQYVDRVCISKAAPLIQRDLVIDDAAMSWIFSAFTIAYALFEIPTGLMGDKFGPRKTLVRVVLWWSFFTMATGWMASKVSMFVCRFLFGAGEAGCFPNLTRAFSTWLRPGEKVRAQAILWMFARLGGAATPLLVTILLRHVSWKTAFFMFGWLGVIWAFFFWRWFRDDPKDHPGVNEAEQALLADNPPVARHDPVPWKRFCASATPWLLWFQYACFSYCWYFYVTWLNKFLDQSYPGVNEFARAALAGVPLFCGAFGNLVAGLLMARLNVWAGGILRARRILGFAGMACAAACFLAPARVIEHPGLVMLAMGAASFFGDLTMPCSWGACMDVGGKFAGTFSGSMNMMGNLGGAVSPVAVAWLVKHFNYQAAFDVSAGVYFLAALCWLFIDPVTPLDRAGEANTHKLI